MSNGFLFDLWDRVREVGGVPTIAPDGAILYVQFPNPTLAVGFYKTAHDSETWFNALNPSIELGQAGNIVFLNR